MDTPYYELHVTVQLATPEEEAKMKEVIDLFDNWHFSKISGDPVLGPGIKAYATTNLNARNGFRITKRILDMMATELHRSGLNVRRAKIETVVYDMVLS